MTSVHEIVGRPVGQEPGRVVMHMTMDGDIMIDSEIPFFVFCIRCHWDCKGLVGL